MPLNDCLVLVDATGGMICGDKRGAMNEELSPKLSRIDLDESQ
ncbi:MULTISPECIES: hypothetical protein [unclassified Oceanobacter]|nr:MULTISPECIES: hypothetical protein [unclassified Oceanobacter]MDO6681274.1 hypothetical protein [Oceanobacter sp. 5_MG-2023]MDP2505207.1 hypothetical protein [Oceanobacter sp. 3_MG-2023]MDP2549192.1 hypothetical protein [Oceanobacter sp. 4_MG-2023]MDP2608019.1 hypothetical protein [Oceanobacter sp. 1_MG-2023]MDP2611319.1 hypothetical protein [Oceanobacter sp. 2_MG-2023]